MNSGSMRRASTTKVLVVEDVDLEAKLLVCALEDAGYSSVERATDVSSAMEKIARGDIRVVVTDLALGGSSGLVLTKSIRERESADYVYIVALTSSGERQMAECFDAGVDDFIRKPFDRLELVARLRAGERIVALEKRLNRKSHRARARAPSHRRGRRSARARACRGARRGHERSQVEPARGLRSDVELAGARVRAHQGHG